jgi:UDP-2-acetamido-2,6-beta-L-arabino-hexul-4-ose reductase
MKIGITGSQGFVGQHLANTLSLQKDSYTIVPFERSFFEDNHALDTFTQQCDVIVHLAGINRHESEQYLCEQNILMAQNIADSLERTGAKPKVVMSSSTQELDQTPYGLAKKQAREILENASEVLDFGFTGLLIPNIFGPFSKPNYNTFIATFCAKLLAGEQPSVLVDKEVPLLYVGDLVDEIITSINAGNQQKQHQVPARATKKVTEILALLGTYHQTYAIEGRIPALENTFEIQLFNTFRSFIDPKTAFPKKLIAHTDARGAFTELIKTELGGQFSFSTTHPDITRGNHFHTRKIERFMVIKGKALIQLRKYGTTEVLNFELDGAEPAYVDMPVWYIHNIKNIGDEVLYTNFWINEAYDPADPDTYFEIV